MLVGLAGTGVRMRLVLLNWNSAVMSCPGGVAEHAHTHLPEVPALKLAFEYFEQELEEARLK